MSSGNLLQEFKLRLKAPAQDNAESRNGYKMEPNFVVGVRDNQPRFTVYTGVVNDKNQGRIEANMDTFTFMAVIEGIRDVANGVVPSFKTENDNFTFPQGKRSEKPMLISTTYVGRDDNGLMFIALLSSNSSRPKIRFIFGPSEFHNMSRGDDSTVSIKHQSELFARGWCNIMEKGVIRVLGDEFISWEDLKARKANNSNNRGGGNRGGNNNYGNNNGSNNNSNNNSSNNNSNDNGGDNDIPW